jgi:Rieske Fe-S protein
MDRRSFMMGGACAFASLTLGGCASLASVQVQPVAGAIRLSLAEHPSLTQKGGWLKVRPQTWSNSVYVLALDDGGYAAISPICTHQSCTVDIAGARLVCPCHGSTYDREGHVLKGPAERALQRFATRVETGELVIEIGDAR